MLLDGLRRPHARQFAKMKSFVIASTIALVAAQDPAQGWLGYAVSTAPASATRITSMVAKWRVGKNPKPSGAFYSPWFGIDAADNLNLLQPVNPWLGNGWSFYTEYYQWSPSHNVNSDQFNINAGDELSGSIVYDAPTDSYTITQTATASGQSSSQVVKAQNGKKFTIGYFVYEKVANCNEYPPDGIVVFYDIAVEYDGAPASPTWTTAFVEDVCNNRAHILNSTSISITWNTKAENPAPALVKASQATPFGRH